MYLNERWSVRVLKDHIAAMLYEGTANGCEDSARRFFLCIRKAARLTGGVPDLQKKLQVGTLC